MPKRQRQRQNPAMHSFTSRGGPPPRRPGQTVFCFPEPPAPHINHNCNCSLPNWNSYYGVHFFNLIDDDSTPFMRAFSACTTDAARLELVLKTQPITRAINSHLDTSFAALNRCSIKCGTIKSSPKAREMISRGKTALTSPKHYINAWCHFTTALLRAPPRTKEYTRALVGRVMANYNLKQFENAFEEIDSALELVLAAEEDYEDEHQKLIEIKTCLLLAKGDTDQAKEFLFGSIENEAQATSKWTEICKEMRGSILGSRWPRPDVRRRVDWSWVVRQKITSGEYETEGTVKSLSTQVAIRWDAEKEAHHVIATCDIKSGTIVAITQEFTTIIDNETSLKLDHCHHCALDYVPNRYINNIDMTFTAPNPVPCPTCCNVLFCSPHCRDIAMATYHRFECGQLPLLRQLVPYVYLILRLLYSAGSVEEVKAVAAVEDPQTFQLEDPVNYANVYSMRVEPIDELKQLASSAIDACLLAKLAVKSGFVKNPAQELPLIRATLLRHFKQRAPNLTTKTTRTGAHLICIDPIRALISRNNGNPNVRADWLNHDEHYEQTQVLAVKAIRDIEEGEELVKVDQHAGMNADVTSSAENVLPLFSLLNLLSNRI